MNTIAMPSAERAAAGEATLLADVGGTNARFALLANGVVGPVAHRHVAEYRSFADALGDFIKHQAIGVKVVAAILAAAGVVGGERCALTNSPWIIDGAELRSRFGLVRVGVLNDFEALARSLPHLRNTDLYALGAGRNPAAGSAMAVLGPGTGLGVAALVPHGGDMIVVATEAGHSDLPAASPREAEVIAHLARQFRHVSAERVLSGAGLENLYAAIAMLSKSTPRLHAAAEIAEAAVAESCPVAQEALNMFCAFLGSVAGNMALTFRARGGVFIGGGIVPRFCNYVARSQFRERFEAKGRLRSYLEPIPTQVIVNTDATFLGLQAAARCPAP